MSQIPKWNLRLRLSDICTSVSSAGRHEAKAMRRIMEDQRKGILARKEEVKRNEAQLTLGFDKMELQQMEEERKDWDKRLTAIGREVDEESARILKSYEVQADRPAVLARGFFTFFLLISCIPWSCTA